MEKFKIFLSQVLKSKYDVELFAIGTIENATENYQEIRGQYTESGNPVIFHFSDFGIEL